MNDCIRYKHGDMEVKKQDGNWFVRDMNSTDKRMLRWRHMGTPAMINDLENLWREKVEAAVLSIQISWESMQRFHPELTENECKEYFMNNQASLEDAIYEAVGKVFKNINYQSSLAKMDSENNL